jgi:hypothetical protein
VKEYARISLLGCDHRIGAKEIKEYLTMSHDGGIVDLAIEDKGEVGR